MSYLGWRQFPDLKTIIVKYFFSLSDVKSILTSMQTVYVTKIWDEEKGDMIASNLGRQILQESTKIHYMSAKIRLGDITRNKNCN